jgi:hypothetical protein
MAETAGAPPATPALPAVDVGANISATAPLPLPGSVAERETVGPDGAGTEAQAPETEEIFGAEGEGPVLPGARVPGAPAGEGSGCLPLETLLESTPEFSRGAEILKSSGGWVSGRERREARRWHLLRPISC